MSKWLSKYTFRKKSADDAKDRLKLILIHDRTDINNAIFDAMREEILQVISNHVKVDQARVKISIVQEGREQRLVADIPLMPYSKR